MKHSLERCKHYKNWNLSIGGPDGWVWGGGGGYSVFQCCVLNLVDWGSSKYQHVAVAENNLGVHYETFLSV